MKLYQNSSEPCRDHLPDQPRSYSNTALCTKSYGHMLWFGSYSLKEVGRFFKIMQCICLYHRQSKLSTLCQFKLFLMTQFGRKVLQITFLSWKSLYRKPLPWKGFLRKIMHFLSPRYFYPLLTKIVFAKDVLAMCSSIICYIIFRALREAWYKLHTEIA